MPIAEDSAGGSPVPIPTNLTTNLTGEATGSGTLDYTTGDIDIAVTVVDNGHNHILENITDVQVNNAISGQILVYNGTVWANATNTSGITAIVQDLTPQLGGNLDLNNRNITGTGNIAITGTIDGRDVSADGTKLDGIESGATADQTAAQIKTAYESNANTNNFADADVSKLSGIEPGATADQTATQIKTAYESNSNTNAFTDADHTKLDGIETAADVTDTTNVVASLTAGTNVTIAADGTISATGGTSGIAHVVDDTTPELGGNLSLNSHDITGTGNLNFTGSVTLSGTVDGRDVAADGTKLDGIEAGANITDTANVTAAGALMDSEVTNLAQVKAFDSSDYATAAQGTTADAALPKAGGTMTGKLTLESSDPEIFLVDTNTNVTTSIDANSSAGSLQIHVDKDETASDPKFIVNVGSQNNVLVAKSTGIDVTGNVDLPDNGKLLLGASDDLQIYHDASNSYIKEVGTGNLFIDATSLRLRAGAGTETYLTADGNGSVDLYYDNAKKLETTSTGIAVTGKIGVGDANTVADHELHIQSSSPTIRLEDTDGNKRFDITQSGNDTNFDFESNVIYKKADGTEVARIDTGGIDVTGGIEVNNSTNYRGIHLRGNGAPNVTFGRNNVTTAEWKAGISGNTGTSFTISEGTAAASERLVIATGGNVGIGTTAPKARTQITSGGTLNAPSLGSSSSNAPLYLTNNDTSYGLVVGNSSADGHVWFQAQRTDGSTTVYNMTLNEAGGNVGVGTSAPTAKMHLFTDGVDQSMFSAQADLGVQNRILTLKSPVSDSSSQPFRWQTSNSILWEIDGTESKSMNLNSAGVLGLGTYSPTAKMHIKDVTNTTASATGSTLLRLDNDVNGDLSQQKTFIDFALFDTNANEVPQVRIGAEVGPNGDANSQEKEGEGAFVIYTNNATTGGTTPTGLNERMRVDYLGNVGIGTATPSVKLDCAGSAKFNDSVEIQADSGFAFTEMGGPSGAFIDLKKPFSDDYDFRVIYDGTASLKTTGNYVSTSTASGYVHIGPQNSSYCHFSTDRTRFYFNQNLVVSGNRVVSSYGGDLLLQRSQASTQQISIGLSQVVMTGQLNIAGANPSSNNGAFEVPVISSSTPAIVSVSAGTTSLRTHHSFENSNGQVGKINTLGTQTFYVTSSDYRLKTDIQPMQGSIDRVKALKPCNFEWIADGTRVDGFIAHEAQEVVPEAISGEKDGMRDKVNIITPLVEATYDDEGNELTAEIPAVTETEQVPDYQGIDQSKIVPLLTSALQDAIAKIEALETRLTALES